MPNVDVPVERAGFSKLIALNPNYFGNFTKSAYQPVNAIQNNTTYEEVTCIGFNPVTNVLEAVIQIKQPTGYAGDPCAAGSYEYVRFYVDYGSGFQDAGYVAVHVHEVGGFVVVGGDEGEAVEGLALGGIRLAQGDT